MNRFLETLLGAAIASVAVFGIMISLLGSELETQQRVAGNPSSIFLAVIDFPEIDVNTDSSLHCGFRSERIPAPPPRSTIGEPVFAPSLVFKPTLNVARPAMVRLSVGEYVPPLPY